MVSSLALGGAGLSLVLVRLGWGGPRVLAAAGWTLAAVSLCVLAWADGAWGLSVGIVCGAIVALLLVLQAGLVSAPGRTRTARVAPAADVPHSWQGVGRRITVFALVVPVSFAASLWLAYGLNAVMTGGGELGANAVSAAMFVQPVAWMLLMTAQMTRTHPRQMISQPAGAAIVGTLLWLIA